MRQFVRDRSAAKKIHDKQRYDRGVRHHEPYKIGDLVLVYDEATAKQKLHESHRGPFRITGFGSERLYLYTLEQLDGTPLKRTFFGDQLRLLVLRSGHLVTGEEAVLRSYQNLRAAKGRSASVNRPAPAMIVNPSESDESFAHP